MHATCRDLYGEHYDMFYVLLPQDETSRAFGRSLMLSRIKRFIQSVQKDSVKLFQHRFVLSSIMMLKVKDLVVIKLVFDVRTKKMHTYWHKV